MRADLPAHVLAGHGRESVVEARGDTGGSDLVRIGMQVRPAMVTPGAVVLVIVTSGMSAVPSMASIALATAELTMQ
jgi:hypothetical protein